MNPSCTGCHWAGNKLACAKCRGGEAKPQPPVKLKARGRHAHVKGEMNKTESAYASHLEARKAIGEIAGYWFEAITVKLGHDCRLTMDFLVQLADGTLELHDTKAGKKTKTKDGQKITPLVEDDARVKMSVAAGMFPFGIFTAHKDGDAWVVKEIG